MPEHEVFSCGNLNSRGICRSICGAWVRKSRLYGNVASIDELGSAGGLGLLWNDPDSDRGIDRNNLLGAPTVHTRETVNLAPYHAAYLVSVNYGYYYLLAIWGRNGGRLSGHSMAIRLTPGNIQFLDPNESCWSYDTRRELHAKITNHITTNYSHLINNCIDVSQFLA
jgi:hypothetical protein